MLAENSGLKLNYLDLYRSPLEAKLDPEEFSRKASFDDFILEQEAVLDRIALLICVYPDWWGQMPALLKGWFDRVFKTGSAYRYTGEDGGRKKATGLLQGITAAAYITSDSDWSGRPSSHELYWRDSICDFTGMDFGAFGIYGPTFGSSSGQRKRWRENAVQSLTALIERSGLGDRE